MRLLDPTLTLGLVVIFFSVTKASITQSSSSVAKGSQISVTCSVKNQPGVSITWKKSGTTLTDSDVYSIQAQSRTSSDVDETTSRVLKVTGTTSIIATADSCTLHDAAQGFVACSQALSCDATYSELAALSNSKIFTVTITGLVGE